MAVMTVPVTEATMNGLVSLGVKELDARSTVHPIELPSTKKQGAGCRYLW